MEVKAREEEVSCTAQSMDRPSRIVCVLNGAGSPAGGGAGPD